MKTSYWMKAIICLCCVCLITGCDQTVPDRGSIDGVREGNVYTNERANFSVTLPEGVEMSEPMNTDEYNENRAAHHYVWAISSPEGNSILFYSEIIYVTECYLFSPQVDALEDNPNVSNIQKEPFYKLLRNKIEYDNVVNGVTYHEIKYVRYYDILTLRYPVDESLHNPTMEQFVQNWEVGYTYSYAILNYDKEILFLIFLAFAAPIILLFLAFGEEWKIGLWGAILLLLVSAPAYGWIGWFMTGVPCGYTYGIITLMAAMPIAGFIIYLFNRK